MLKKKLDDAKGLWAEKLPEVLWAIRTTPTEATGETPFSLMYGTEAVLPLEIASPTARVAMFDLASNTEGVNLDKVLVEEKRLEAHRHNLQNKQRVARFYNSRVKNRSLQLGDWVLKQVMPKPKGLNPKWEGPYKIIEVLAPSTFRLQSKCGEELKHSWNVDQLRYYYK